MNHIKQDILQLAAEVKDKHGGCVVLSLIYVDGVVKKLKLHYFKTYMEAADYIMAKYYKASYEEEMAFDECSVRFPCSVSEYLQFVVIDKKDFEKLADELRERQDEMSRKSLSSHRMSSREEMISRPLSPRSMSPRSMSPRSMSPLEELRMSSRRMSPREEMASNM